MWSYIIIPVITVCVALGGSLVTSKGMNWYHTIKIPSWAPSGGFIGVVWTIIFILTAISAIVFWDKHQQGGTTNWIIILFSVNAVLNVLWSYFFFKMHLIGTAFIEAILLWISVVGLIILIWPISVLAAALLIPYALWGMFASYINYLIWNIN